MIIPKVFIFISSAHYSETRTSRVALASRMHKIYLHLYYREVGSSFARYAKSKSPKYSLGSALHHWNEAIT